eukprot:CAMPEP_0181323396 /NCGR_PEP_ID=MMETSP1101-20121128/19764_1 /TAXON_ID=46948 /ORGANISM="Rhodomonas abbreviata, Strain Caron Lab Isolate" /LENGTH=217 /DNA_ID=CAMNT_0023431423 /DNA_START=23 /DNA_END=676 /DNA_ORIENTATION=+
MPLKLHGLPMSGSALPIVALLEENGVEYESVTCNLMEGAHKTPEFLKMNPMHCIPTMDDDGFHLWEGRAISRYICNKHKLESWYPSDPKKRGLCELGLDWHLSSFAPSVAANILYPAAGFAGPVSDETVAATEKKWNEDLWPALQFMIKSSGGPFIGGDKPCIADLHIFIHAWATQKKVPNSFFGKHEGMTAYVGKVKACLKKWDSYAQAAEGFYSP